MANLPSVAIIDIGSNSIKVLVAQRAPDRSITTLFTRTIDARISAGISQVAPRLGEDGMTRGLEAIRALLADITRFAPAHPVLVGTSAVRDAGNSAEFRTRVRAATGLEIRILSGDEEANLIGRGLVCDPALQLLRDFCVFDLGGGSLECLAFRDRQIQQAASLPLGCVRLTEKFLPNAEAPFPREAAAAIAAHCRTALAAAGFDFSLPAGAATIGTGGTVATVRAILTARAGNTFEQSDSFVTVAALRDLLDELGRLTLAERKKIPGLPPPRADVFPTALATLIAVAEAGGFIGFRNSLYNLRYGLAAEALA